MLSMFLAKLNVGIPNIFSEFIYSLRLQMQNYSTFYIFFLAFYDLETINMVQQSWILYKWIREGMSKEK